MRILVASCSAYSDCWPAFFGLFKQFWPDCPFDVHLITDTVADPTEAFNSLPMPSPRLFKCHQYPGSWIERLAAFASRYQDDSFMMLQEDFLLTAPVNSRLIEEGLQLLLTDNHTGSVRLYPCPGADTWTFNENFGYVDPLSQYLISCQASIWNPHFVVDVAKAVGPGSASDFEVRGSLFASSMHWNTLAFRRDVHPWPLEYICTAIVKGLWDPAAKQLCEQHGIPMDWSRRGFYK